MPEDIAWSQKNIYSKNYISEDDLSSCLFVLSRLYLNIIVDNKFKISDKINILFMLLLPTSEETFDH